MPGGSKQRLSYAQTGACDHSIQKELVGCPVPKTRLGVNLAHGGDGVQPCRQSVVQDRAPGNGLAATAKQTLPDLLWPTGDGLPEGRQAMSAQFPVGSAPT